jgi:c-di-GMP-binding flagellar brake protein YcgR
MMPRKDRRFKQWNKTQIWLLTDPRITDSQPSIEAFTYDLSIGGARLHTSESIEVGERIRIQAELVRTGDLLRVEAVVRWRRWDETANVYEMGVEFQHTSMVTVVTLMKNLHDGRRTAPSPKTVSSHDGLSRS